MDSAGSYSCATCFDDFPAPHFGICSSCEAPGLLCERCFSTHSKTPPPARLAAHDFTKSDVRHDRDALLDSLKLQLPPVECEAHHKPFSITCSSHSPLALLCADCVDTHSSHVLGSLSTAAIDARGRLGSVGVAVLERTVEEAGAVVAALATSLDSLPAQYEAAAATASAARDLLLATLTSRFEVLTGEANALLTAKVTDIGHRQQVSDELLSHAKACLSGYRRAVTVFSDVDVATHTVALLRDADNLAEAVEALKAAPLIPAVVRLSFGEALARINDALRSLGTVSGTAADELRATTPDHEVAAVRVAADRDATALRARIAALEGELKATRSANASMETRLRDVDALQSRLAEVTIANKALVASTTIKDGAIASLRVCIVLSRFVVRLLLFLLLHRTAGSSCRRNWCCPGSARATLSCTQVDVQTRSVGKGECVDCCRTWGHPAAHCGSHEWGLYRRDE